eukprot:m.71402 g.71402  ORF g.71402 m.71402 type:complete len:440 (+) comp12941_c1_seq1:102-1421(+)
MIINAVHTQATQQRASKCQSQVVTLRLIARIENACADTGVHLFERLVDLLRSFLLLNVDDEIADAKAGVEGLCHNIGPAENSVDVAQHAGLIAMEVEHTRVPVRQPPCGRDVGHVNGADGRTAVDKVNHLLRNLLADGSLGLFRGPADVRRQDGVGTPLQRRRKVLARARRLAGEHIKRGAGEMAALEGGRGGIDVDHVAPASIDEIAARPHLGNLRGANHATRACIGRHMQRHKVGALQQGCQRGHRLGCPQRQLGHNVVEDDLHAQRLGNNGQLRPDVPVAHQPQHLAAHFKATVCCLLPRALVQLHRPVCCLPGQHDDLGQHQLGDAAGVAVRAVEDRDAMLRRGGKVHLVGADAEAAGAEEAAGGGEHGRGELGLGADADGVHCWDDGQKLLLRVCARRLSHLKSTFAENRCALRVDLLQEQHLNFARWEAEELL